MDTFKLILDQVVIPVTVAFLLGLVGLLIRAASRWVEAKTHIHVSESVEQAFEEAVRGGIHHAEQCASARLKAGGSGTPPAENVARMADAREYILEEIKRRKLPEVAAAAIEDRVEAELGKLKAGARQ